MARLRQKDAERGEEAAPLTDDQKARIAEVRQAAQAKLAQESQPAYVPAEGEMVMVAPGPELTPEMLEAAKFKAQIAFQMLTVGVTVSVGLTCLAVLASLLLGRVSRQATLRQINASLLEISNQLKELRHSAATKMP